MLSQLMAIVCMVLMSCSLVTALFMFYGMYKDNSVKVLGGLGATMGIWMLVYIIIKVMAVLQSNGLIQS